MNRKIVITGASRGIGRAAALRFAEAGDQLILTGFSHPEKLREVREMALKAGAPLILPFVGDLSRPEEIKRLFEDVKNTFGAPDLLINNAGISLVGLVQDLSDEESLRLFSTNLLSVIRASKEAVRLMLPKHSGRILNISSVFGTVGASCEAEYSAAKGGIDSFTKALAKELAPSGIAVNALSLGAISTEMNSRLSPDEVAALEEEIPFGRMGTPEEVAEMLFLLAEAPLYLTGSVIRFDGAWT